MAMWVLGAPDMCMGFFFFSSFLLNNGERLIERMPQTVPPFQTCIHISPPVPLWQGTIKTDIWLEFFFYRFISFFFSCFFAAILALKGGLIASLLLTKKTYIMRDSCWQCCHPAGRKSLGIYFFFSSVGSCFLKGLWKNRSCSVQTLRAIWPPGCTAAFRVRQLVTNPLEPFSMQTETRDKRQENKIRRVGQAQLSLPG